MKTLVAALASALVAAGISTVTILHASSDRDVGKFVYPVGVLCQFPGGTTISVHNPNDRTITLRKTGIALAVGQGPTAPQAKELTTLKRDWAFLIGCDEIAVLGGIGIGGTGNVIIESDHELDVWAVYTSIVAGGGIGETRGPIRVLPTTVGR